MYDRRRYCDSVRFPVIAETLRSDKKLMKKTRPPLPIFSVATHSYYSAISELIYSLGKQPQSLLLEFSSHLSEMTCPSFVSVRLLRFHEDIFSETTMLIRIKLGGMLQDRKLLDLACLHLDPPFLTFLYVLYDKIVVLFVQPNVLFILSVPVKSIRIRKNFLEQFQFFFEIVRTFRLVILSCKDNYQLHALIGVDADE